jgi:hypothetical protein
MSIPVSSSMASMPQSKTSGEAMPHLRGRSAKSADLSDVFGADCVR